MSGNLQSALEAAEEEIGKESEECGRDGAGEDEGIADQSDAAKDESAETACADGGGDGGDADGDDGGGANAGENDGERERETDAEEDLRASHAHGLGGFKDSGIDGRQGDLSGAQDGEQRVEDQRDNGGALANAADERDGNQKAEEGEAGDGLEHAGDAQRDGAQGGPLHNEHAERDSDENGNDHGDENECEVIESGAENFGAVIGEERPSGHLGAHAGAPGVMPRDEVKARTSGWSRRRNSCGVALATMRPGWSRTTREAGGKGAEFALELGARDGIERAEGLVHQKDGRIGSESTGDTDALTLAAGKFAGAAMGEFAGFEADKLEHFIDASGGAGGVPLFQSGNKGDVFRDSEMGEEASVLNDVTDAAAEADGVPIGGRAILDEDFPFRGKQHSIH